mmetsp:Transcript_19976/g.43302  ORF Transcript_19976/g.43302 Transcript_19976/m.43302 type:complete len:84 (+) Transcript_19976:1022-1273(+)
MVAVALLMALGITIGAADAVADERILSGVIRWPRRGFQASSLDVSAAYTDGVGEWRLRIETKEARKYRLIFRVAFHYVQIGIS